MSRSRWDHSDDPSKPVFDFKKATPENITDKCLTCHASGSEHISASNSFHRQNDVACTSCHSMHHAKTKEHMLIKSEPGLCYSCHLQQKAQFNMPFRHRVNEGLISCTDCHNQHGTGGVLEGTIWSARCEPLPAETWFALSATRTSRDPSCLSTRP